MRGRPCLLPGHYLVEIKVAFKEEAVMIKAQA
jgi:hypothetical protein